ncbi:MAG: AraC family transcriptional regulator, partial [Bacteroidales bacterium]|nr:AraC family transcriptional regulator [Bacteroidales bacterium]
MKKIMPALIGLLMRVSSTVVDPTQKNVNKRISRQFHLWVAEKRYCQPDISLADVAEEFGVSVEALSYFFSVVVGQRFTSIRKKLRLEEARRIICEHPEYKIVMVANIVGIQDKCNFRKQFHEV